MAGMRDMMVHYKYQPLSCPATIKSQPLSSHSHYQVTATIKSQPLSSHSHYQVTATIKLQAGTFNILYPQPHSLNLSATLLCLPSTVFLLADSRLSGAAHSDIYYMGLFPHLAGAPTTQL